MYGFRLVFFLKIIQQLISMGDRRLWTPEEDQIIQRLVSQHGCTRWTLIAQEMKTSHYHLARSSKQIRERWHNHLNPAINRQPWTEEEEIIIFEAHKRVGSKWKQIAKLLTARTDNAVKNHFYSSLRRSLRRINKFLGFKNSTNQMRVLKPSTLCKLIDDSENNEESRVLLNGILEFSKFKPNKNNKMSALENLSHTFLNFPQRQAYEQAFQNLLKDKFDFFYHSEKTEKKCSTSHKKNMKKQPHSSKMREQASKQNSRINLEEMEELTSKGYDSHDPKRLGAELHWEQEEEGLEGMQWQESNGDKFCGMLLPELEKPEEEQDLLGVSCSAQQFFH